MRCSRSSRCRRACPSRRWASTTPRTPRCSRRASSRSRDAGGRIRGGRPDRRVVRGNHVERPHAAREARRPDEGAPDRGLRVVRGRRSRASRHRAVAVRAPDGSARPRQLHPHVRRQLRSPRSTEQALPARPHAARRHDGARDGPAPRQRLPDPAAMSEVAELAAELVRIDSVNPALIPGAAGEGEAARFVASWLERAGLEVEAVEPAPGRPSVIGIARGSSGGRSLMLNGHLDTVGTETMTEPFEPRLEDGRLYGRGSYDMKGAVAAMLLAAADCARRRLPGDVIVVAVADEELASVGTTAVLERVHPDAAIVCEPTELRVAVAHRGFAGFEIVTHGVAAHGSRPDLGIDAIAKMGHVLVGLEELDERLQAGARHPLLGSASLHASLITGGQELSSYPARCVLSGERRTIPGESTADVERQLRSTVGDADVRMIVARGPFEIEAEHELVRAVGDAAGTSGVVGLPFWTDAGLVAEAGIPTVLFGPAGEGAHAAVEWVDVASLDRCRAVYSGVAEAVCR